MPQANIAAIALAIEGGADLADKINPRLISLQLTESREDKSDRLEIVLHNTDGQLAPIRKGVILTLGLGWKQGDDVPAGMVDKGRYTVDEVERSGPPDVVTIRASAADFTGGWHKRKTAVHKDTTLGALIGKIAQANGYQAKVHPDLAGKAIDQADQAGKSDMTFLRDLGKRFDAVATVKDRTVLFAPIGRGQTAAGTALPALTLTRRDGWTWRFAATSRDEHDGAEAQWHDKDQARRRTAKAGGAKKAKRLKRVYATEGDAKQAAEAERQRQARGVFTFEYTLAFGDPAIVPERPVALAGWDSEIDGIVWLVKEAVHSLGAQGLATRIVLESKG